MYDFTRYHCRGGCRGLPSFLKTAFLLYARKLLQRHWTNLHISLLPYSHRWDLLYYCIMGKLALKYGPTFIKINVITHDKRVYTFTKYIYIMLLWGSGILSHHLWDESSQCWRALNSSTILAYMPTYSTCQTQGIRRFTSEHVCTRREKCAVSAKRMHTTNKTRLLCMWNSFARRSKPICSACERVSLSVWNEFAL